MDISIVVLTYYHEQFIARALDTILSQKFNGSYEIIVSDDFSQDRTLDIVNSYQEKYPGKIVIIKNIENVGISRNAFNAYCSCKSKYIVTTAGDDYWLDDLLLQKKFDYLEVNPGYIADASVVKEVYLDGEPNGIVLPQKKHWGKEYFRRDFERLDYYQNHALMFRNVLLFEEGRKKFELVPQFSRDLDDVTLRFIMFDFGRIHIDDNINYALLVRRPEDTNQYNYNTKYKRITNTCNFLQVINHLNDYYQGKVEFKYWYRNKFYEILFYFLQDRDFSILKNLRFVPAKFRVYCWLMFPIELISFIIRVVGRNIGMKKS